MKRLVPMLVLFLLLLTSCGTAPAQPRAITVGLALPAEGSAARPLAECAEAALRELSVGDEAALTLHTAAVGDQTLTQVLNGLSADADLGAAVGEGSAASLSMCARSVLSLRPETDFVLLDGEGIEAANVTCCSFALEEASFLAGIAAARATDSGTVGLLQASGNDREACAAGFIAGVRSVSSSTLILQQQPAAAAEELDAAVVDLVQKGADVIFCVSQSEKSALLAACAREGVWAVTTAQDDADLAESSVFAVVVKDIGFAAKAVAERAMRQTLERGSLRFDLASGGVRLALREGVLGEKSASAFAQAVTAVENGERDIPADLAALEERFPGAYTLR